MKPITRDDTVHGVEYVTMAEANAAVAEWSERACNLQHELNVALRERDQARFDLGTSVRTTAEHGQTIMADREAMRMALVSLREGRDALFEQAAAFHQSMAGYKPERHEWMDDEVARADAAIKALEQRVGES